ncbi:nucleotidyltransferase domain-containing protein [Microlunatus parietis]|uniref:Polymerase nucleotidyl transferase domain-containing protein n=1 Tax=Microlunatus parietis TaxID=682979 RepID=A0A7Y9I5X0_9ACTN|nr:nucleotidyltransferase domain-containing protein [Microlunatus parietis]NYE70880.1 hypothetical protein [Microlunatus parietis]
MTERTDGVIERARAWAAEDPELLGLVVYGSVAQGRTHELSDVDLVVVTAAGSRERLWDRRLEIAARLLAEPVAWSHELPWQGQHRFQAWRSDLLGVDLTFDEGRVEQHDVFATGQPKALAGDVIIPTPDPPDPRGQAKALDAETWIWLLGIHNQLRQGRTWDAYVQFTALLDTRLATLLGPEEVAALVPRAVTTDELLRQLRRAVADYDRLRHTDALADPTFALAYAIRTALLGGLG